MGGVRPPTGYAAEGGSARPMTSTGAAGFSRGMYMYMYMYVYMYMYMYMYVHAGLHLGFYTRGSGQV